MRVSQHGEIWAAVAPSTYDGSKSKDEKGWKAYFKRVGMAQSVRVEDNFGTQQLQFVGRPISQPIVGYTQSTVSLEVCTIKGDDFRNLGAMNPLWAHLPIYEKERLISMPSEVESEFGVYGDKMMPYTFILAVRNKISGSYSETHTVKDAGIGGMYAPSLDGTNRRSSLTGLYACVLGNASVAYSAQNAMIIDSATAQATMLSGSWLNKEIKRTLRGEFSHDANEQNNGVRDILSLFYGYAINGTGGEEDFESQPIVTPDKKTLKKK